jgi:membrane protein
MNELVARVERFFGEDLWRRDAWWIRFLQGCVVIVEGFVRDQLLLRAHSLTYITVLSLIPLLALGLGIAGLLGLRERVAEQIFVRMGTIAPDVAGTLRDLVEGFDFGSLGALGGSFLFLTTVLVVGNVERSFNHIWGVTKQRSWMRRIPDYLFVIMIAPVVLGVALSLGTTLQSPKAVQFLMDIPFFEAMWGYGLAQLPLVLFVLGFLFIYWFLPNTKVRIDSAAVGGLVAGLLFPILLRGYVGFAVGAAKMNAIFGGFAQFPLFLVFTYFTWAVVLLGAEVSFAYQNVGRYRREVKGSIPGPAGREAIGLAIAVEVARRFELGADPCTADELADALDVRIRTVRDVLDALETAGILAERADDDRSGGFQLGRPAERIPVGEVLRAIRGEREPVTAAIDGVFEELEKRQREITEQETLADLLRG